MNQEPRLVIVASTMRSGSTLLKALLAEAEDVLNLPETNFQNQRVVQKVLSQHREDEPFIKVLKKPAWYQESKRYPRLPAIPGTKTVALIRDVYDTVVSLRKMTFRKLAGITPGFVTRWLARRYWVNVTSSLIRLSTEQPDDVIQVQYEGLLQDPIAETEKLYRFIGSSRKTGTRTYSAPNNYAWKWGTDDGSDNIKSLEVQPPRPKKRTDTYLQQIIDSDPEIRSLREQLGYAE